MHFVAAIHNYLLAPTDLKLGYTYTSLIKSVLFQLSNVRGRGPDRKKSDFLRRNCQSLLLCMVEIRLSLR